MAVTPATAPRAVGGRSPLRSMSTGQRRDWQRGAPPRTARPPIARGPLPRRLTDLKPTPFQPGASPGGPLPLYVAIPVALALLGRYLWGLINYKPEPKITPLQPGVWVTASTGNDVLVRLWYKTRQGSYDRYFCSPPEFQRNYAQVDSAYTNWYGTATQWQVTGTVGTYVANCGSGVSNSGTLQPRLKTRTKSGFVNEIAMTQVGAYGFTGSKRDTLREDTVTGVFAEVNGVTSDGSTTTVPEIPEAVRVSPKAPTPAEAKPVLGPLLLPRPALRPGPLINPQPITTPSVKPRPGQAPAPAPATAPAPMPRPSIAPAPLPAQPAPFPVPAIGPLPAPAPLPVPVTDPSVVVISGQVLGGPGQSPAANLVAIAQEVGRLEAKSEALMRRPENGGPGEVPEWTGIKELLDALEEFIRDQLDNVDGGSYLLVAPCPPPGGGEPLPPVEVPYDGGTNAAVACLARIDALAALIQAHKNMGQPTCQTPIYGDEVTVHFESP